MTHKHGLLMAAACAALLTCGSPVLAVYAKAAAPAAPTHEVVQELMRKDFVGAPGKELLMLTVEYLPGGASLPHRHNAQVLVYVLSGTMHMQVKGSPVLTLGPGQTFYEGPSDEHTVSENASQTEAAKILVFEVKDKS